MKVIILGGGTSTEREVSLRSAQAVLNALDQAGLEAVFIDPKADQSYLEADPEDVIFPILHGKFGEDGTLQQWLEEKEIAYLGSDSNSSKNSFDKWITQQTLQKHGVRIPRSDYILYSDYADHTLSTQPHVLKIPDGGSSIGTYIFRKPLDDKSEAEHLFAGQKIIIEELIEGIETTVPILDQAALPVIEIQPPTDGEFDYENKYNGKTKEICPPVSIDNDKQVEIQRLAEKVHKIMGCRHLSRVDIMLDKAGECYVLEINTIPGLTDQSLFPKSARQAGLEMPDLAKHFYDMVCRDYSLE